MLQSSLVGQAHGSRNHKENATERPRQTKEFPQPRAMETTGEPLGFPKRARKCNSRALRARSARSARSFHIFKFQNPHTFSQIFDWRYLRGTPFFQKIGRQRKYHEKTFWVRRFVRAVPLLRSWLGSGISVSGPFVLKFSGLPSGLARWVSFGTPFSKSLGDTW